jgi:hypothetical protein
MSLAPCQVSYKGLANQHGCALHADAAQAGELLDHLAGPVRSIGRRNLIPFTLKLCNLRKYELQPSEQTLNFGQCIRWDWLVEARSQFSQPATSTLKKRIIVVDAKCRQNSADSVREADTIGEQLGPFADTPPSILIGFVWDRDHRTHAGLAAKPSKQSAQEQLGIDAIRFRSA